MCGADCRRGSKVITALLVYLERLGGEKSFMKLPLPFLGFYVCLNIRRYYTAFLGGMTAETTSVILGAVKKDHRSGKERLCCRCIQTELKIHIACLISRARLCRPQCMRKGLFVYAFIRPDQVDVWDREPLCEPRDNQIDCSD